MSNSVVSDAAITKLNFNADQVVAVVKTTIDVAKQLLAAATSVNTHFQNVKVADIITKVNSVIALIEKFLGNQNVMNVITLLLKLLGSNTPPTQAELTGAVLGALVG